MNLTVDEARWLLMGDLEGWEVIEENYSHSSRWESHYTSIVHNLESNKYYLIKWSRGATEQQGTRPFEYSKPELIEVEKKEVVVTKTVWERVSNE